MGTVKRAVISALALFVCISAAGCIAVGGSDNFHKPTLGRQLMDLKTARDTGAISDDEYRDAKSDLLRGRVSNARMD